MTETRPPFPEENQAAAPVAASPLVLLALLGSAIAFAILGSAIYQILARTLGWDANIGANAFPADAPEAARWQMRYFQAITHFCTFTLAGSFTVALFYRYRSSGRPGWQDFLGTHWPGLRPVGLSLLLAIASWPLVMYTFMLNKAVPMSDSIRAAEAVYEAAIKGIMQMPDTSEFAANFFLVAILAALGEELVFRGILQKQLLLRTGSPWLAILMSATVFTLIHFQFSGLAPRFLMGVLLGLVYWRSGSLWPGIFTHLFLNGAQVMALYAFQHGWLEIDPDADPDIPWLVALISAFMSAVAVRLIYQSSTPART
jgi:uncharacterized protein